MKPWKQLHQTPKELYQFSDFPWPDSVTAHYPCKQEVMDYLRSYADRFNLIDHIRFNTKVVSLRYEGAGEEEIEVWSYWGGTGEPFSSKGRWFLTIQDNVRLSLEVDNNAKLTWGFLSGEVRRDKMKCHVLFYFILFQNEDYG
ncbi:hypothetical protein Leryth_018859 [Lithospermum erythrorhizon]|nr:hypothetical protein Leryth_018859 [Lithospermum erythrorhizon]